MQHDKDKDPNVTAGSNSPRWWSKDHTSSWTRIKEALRRDWEQTKHDFSKKSGQELNQDAGDTLKQMAGKEPVGDWNSVEPAMRYGYGAGSNYKDVEFDAHEKTLESEWNEMRPSRPWAESRDFVRRGWEYSRRKD
ncbi:MAG: hypothetical protein JWN44_501 [Myxococcales bacterium]|nr:hypothetical protein [Myxococcales bacterium]